MVVSFLPTAIMCTFLACQQDNDRTTRIAGDIGDTHLSTTYVSPRFHPIGVRLSTCGISHHGHTNTVIEPTPTGICSSTRVATHSTGHIWYGNTYFLYHYK